MRTTLTLVFSILLVSSAAKADEHWGVWLDMGKDLQGDALRCLATAVSNEADDPETKCSPDNCKSRVTFPLLGGTAEFTAIGTQQAHVWRDVFIGDSRYGRMGFTAWNSNSSIRMRVNYTSRRGTSICEFVYDSFLGTVAHWWGTW